VLFRIFDVTKPFPARSSQDAPGGIGIMVDDLIAGLYALIVIVIGRAVFAWPCQRALTSSRSGRCRPPAPPAPRSRRPSAPPAPPPLAASSSTATRALAS